MEIYNEHIFSSVQLTLQTVVRLIYRNDAWATCPNGTYLQGIYKSGDNLLHNIDKGKCCKPKGHLDRWGQCYDQNVSRSFDYEGWSNCSEGYYIVGVYRGSCDYIQCIDAFKCCQMERKYICFPRPITCFFNEHEFHFIAMFC